MNNKCFVIQPFDKDTFDQRYKDTFKPAIENAGLTTYRVDEDPSSTIPIQSIENQIRESVICFAEITTDNPNVWYELGYAFACGKEVVMVCAEEERSKFPFDIQHRNILTYKTQSKSDFERLEKDITQKIKILCENAKTVETLNVNPLVETEGLKSHEIALLVLIMESSISDTDSSSIRQLKINMNKSGYVDLATAVATKTLVANKMIEVYEARQDWDGEPYTACKITPKGSEWILSNVHLFEFRKPEKIQQEFTDSLPF